MDSNESNQPQLQVGQPPTLESLDGEVGQLVEEVNFLRQKLVKVVATVGALSAHTHDSQGKPCLPLQAVLNGMPD